MRSTAAAPVSRLRWSLVALFLAATVCDATASAQEPRPIPAVMFDLRGGLGLEHSNAPFRDDPAGLGSFGVALRITQRVAIDLNLSGLDLVGGRDKVNAIQHLNGNPSLPYFTSRGVTAGLLVGLGPARQPERTTFAFGAGVFVAADADAPMGSSGKVLGFNAGIEQAFEFMSHYGVTIGLHPQLLVSLLGGTWTIAPVSIGLRLF